MSDSPDNPPDQAPNPLLAGPSSLPQSTVRPTLPNPPKGRRAASLAFIFHRHARHARPWHDRPVLPRLEASFAATPSTQRRCSASSEPSSPLCSSSALPSLDRSPIASDAVQSFFSPTSALASTISSWRGLLPLAGSSGPRHLRLYFIQYSDCNGLHSRCPPRERRAAAFSMLSAAFSLGFVLGPAVGNRLLGTINPRALSGRWLPLAPQRPLWNLRPARVAFPPSRIASRRRANPVGSLSLLRHGSMLPIAGLLLLGYIAQRYLTLSS